MEIAIEIAITEIDEAQTVVEPEVAIEIANVPEGVSAVETIAMDSLLEKESAVVEEPPSMPEAGSGEAMMIASRKEVLKVPGGIVGEIAREEDGIVAVLVQESATTFRDESSALEVVKPEINAIDASSSLNIIATTSTISLVAPSTIVLQNQLSAAVQEGMSAGDSLHKNIEDAYVTGQSNEKKLVFIESEIHKLQGSIHFLKNVGTNVDKLREDLENLSHECVVARDDNSLLTKEVDTLSSELATSKEGYTGLATDSDAYKSQMSLEMASIHARLTCLEWQRVVEKNLTGRPDPAEHSKS